MFPEYKIIISDAPEANSYFKIIGNSKDKYQFRVIYYDTLASKNAYFKHGSSYTELPKLNELISIVSNSFSKYENKELKSCLFEKTLNENQSELSNEPKTQQK